MKLKEFADEHRLPFQFVRGDDSGIIPGSEGHSQIFEYGGGLLGVLVMPASGTSHRWKAARSAFLAAGMTIRQDGDSEGIATFSPDNLAHVRLALRYAKVRSRRRISEIQKQRLRQIGFKTVPVVERTDFSRTVEGDLMR